MENIHFAAVKPSDEYKKLNGSYIERLCGELIDLHIKNQDIRFPAKFDYHGIQKMPAGDEVFRVVDMFCFEASKIIKGMNPLKFDNNKPFHEYLEGLPPENSLLLYNKCLEIIPLHRLWINNIMDAITKDRMENKKVENQQFEKRTPIEGINRQLWNYSAVCDGLCGYLLSVKLELTEQVLTDLMTWFLKEYNGYSQYFSLRGFTSAVEKYCVSSPVSPALESQVENFIRQLRTKCKFSNYYSGFITKIPLLIRKPLESGEAWSDAAREYLKSQEEEKWNAWLDFLIFCRGFTGAKPSAQWEKEADKFVKKIGADNFKQAVVTWFPLFSRKRTEEITAWDPNYTPDPNLYFIEEHMDIMRGLVWCCSLLSGDADIPRLLARTALACYKKVPKRGPKAMKVGHACIYVLGNIPGMLALTQLAIVKTRVHFQQVQKEITKAFEAAAKREGLNPEEIEELSVPTYGLEEAGFRREELGDCIAELKITNDYKVQLKWFSKDNIELKNPPKEVKDTYTEEIKELQTSLKDLGGMMTVLKHRIDRLFLQQKQWKYSDFIDRYIDHPFTGVLGRRLIWDFKTGEKSVSGIFRETGFITPAQSPIKTDETTMISIWHPMNKSLEEILAWRTYLAGQKIIQPVKQAFREVYLLSEDEKATSEYSNRFAGHILKQYPFNSLCQVRGWKNQLRLCVDDSFPPATLELPQWDMRAEFWIEGTGEYSKDTSSQGVYTYLKTDQVRFYALHAPQHFSNEERGGYHIKKGADDVPHKLEKVPAIVFSEIMRDVDLFTGVASIGNDPDWQDTGNQGSYKDYWYHFSYGDLSETAKTRKAIVEQIITALVLTDKCSFENNFLVVKGKLKTYKIHYGTGKVLIQPNNIYLAFKQQASIKEEIFLPVPDDDLLSDIISKALMLVEDAKIKDASILNQIKKAV